MADNECERVICVKNEVFVFKIPPRPSNRGYRAADWKLDNPDWTGRMRIVSKGKDLMIKLEDKTSGELFANCPVESYPCAAVEPVLDSSRYFVLRIKDENGRSAFIGIGFVDRADSFDLNVSIQDHFKWLKQEADEANSVKELQNAPKLDLGFKEGQTIKLNIGNLKCKEGSSSRPRAKASAGGMIGLIPPPPGGVKIPPPSPAKQPIAVPTNTTPERKPVVAEKKSETVEDKSGLDDFDIFNVQCNISKPANQSTGNSVDLLSSVLVPGVPASQNSGNHIDLLCGTDIPISPSVPVQPIKPVQPVTASDPWGDFTSASSTSEGDKSDPWVQF
ncbi:adaptin ear-binding coat-associated protein 1-like [Gigantopelta aegis]|uniref:adaptin ear-binding coat-associated protein 1-like n=1 Tax=Gigantopelta aegis TaxID=1735272 RepID=UPI001B889805|nr:adaptin ear-binding coat-associated protein 1-like [Gigantopelta aegis]